MRASPRSNAVSRRAFLRLAVVASGSALLAACQQQPAPPPSSGQAAKPAETKPAEAAKPAAPAAAAPTAAPAKPAEAAKPAADAKPAAAAQPAPAAKRGGTFTYAEAGDFNSFNPWAVTATNQAMYNLTFGRLLYKDVNSKEVADMAESWEMAKDGLSFTVKMKQGIKWHDGKEHVADDYVKMFGYTKDDTLLKNAAVKKFQGYIAPIKDIKAADQYTVRFEFGAPVPYIADLIDYWHAIRIEDMADPDFMKKPPLGTGPFKMAEWQPNQFARFSRHAEYFVKDQPVVDEVMFKRLEKAETLIPNLQSGGVDSVLVTSAADIAPLQGNADLKIETFDIGSVYNIQVNCTRPPFDKKEARQALSYSLNREEMAKTAFFGVSKPIATPFYSPNSLAYREDLLNAHKFDLDKAAKLLESAGLKNLEISTSVTPRWPQMKLFMLLWQADLAKIGVKLTVNEVETAKFYEIATDPNMQGAELHPWLNGRLLRDPAILWSSQANFRGNERNIFGYRNPELEKLVADGAVEIDSAKRKQMYQRLNEIVVDDAYLIHVATDPRIWAMKKGVNNFSVDLIGNIIVGPTSVTS
ncbi:MAG TPA: ABC transporter substrate-binding protein [Chloroflexota bacterium]|nr:ABC transporter substrate-binding protein [Chloroflexota bacterium]